MNRSLTLILVAASLLVGCNLPASAGGTATNALRPLTRAALQNTQIHSPDWGDYQLRNGLYQRTPAYPGESATAYTTVFREPITFGDLNADGAEDAVIFLDTQNGGTGHFIEMAAMLNLGGQPRNAATIGLGDRVGIEAARIESGVITLEMRVQGPNDPMCCASQAETWLFGLRGDQLIRLP